MRQDEKKEVISEKQCDESEGSESEKETEKAFSDKDDLEENHSKNSEEFKTTKSNMSRKMSFWGGEDIEFNLQEKHQPEVNKDKKEKHSKFMGHEDVKTIGKKKKKGDDNNSDSEMDTDDFDFNENNSEESEDETPRTCII